MDIKLSVLARERKRQAAAEQIIIIKIIVDQTEIFEIMTWVTVDDINKMP